MVYFREGPTLKETSYAEVLAHHSLPVASIANGIENNPPYPVAEAPQLPLEVYSEDFAKILGTRPKLIHLARGFGFTEGPVYLAVKDTEEGYLLFTDQINDNILIMRWHGIKPYNQITPLSWSTPVIFRHPSSIADGQTLDLTGRLLTAETTGHTCLHHRARRHQQNTGWPVPGETVQLT